MSGPTESCPEAPPALPAFLRIGIVVINLDNVLYINFERNDRAEIHFASPHLPLELHGPDSVKLAEYLKTHVVHTIE